MTAAMCIATLIAVAENTTGSVGVSTGFQIAAAGMTTVFVGLVILSIVLPLLWKWTDRKKKSCSAGEAAFLPLSEEEVAAVIAAIHAHFCHMDQAENMKLTWEMYEKPYTPWRLAGRAESIGSREVLLHRNRSR